MSLHNTTPSRPDPDALLAQVAADEARQRRGKLKIFLGAAPGVGKTFAMLEEARKRAAEDVNVLVGYAEQHIRPDTEALLLGMEILPYRMVEYRGTMLKEFDLDGALARKPSLVLVDELAHTNPPGLRHQKRWQDVAELLDAGIDVYTTLNVQHLESINDVVERITGITVRETLPDSVLENADDVELIDTAPNELLERLSEGKVYRADIADRAVHHFFNKGNLIALRELALRKTADRVDHQMQDFRRDNAVSATWAAGERILVCISASPLSARLVRAAKRLAVGLKAPWIAAYVEPVHAGRLSHADQERVSQTLHLAQQLGAETVTLGGQGVADELVAYARARNVTKIVIGKPQRARWREIINGSLVDEVIRRSGQIDVYVIRGEADAAPSRAQLSASPPVNWAGYGWSVIAAAVCTGVAWAMDGHFAPANLIMVYLLGVVAIATAVGRGPAVLISLLSVAAFDFFFVPPRWTLSVADTQYLVTFAVMLVVALVISTLTNRVRQHAADARSRERRTAALLGLTRELAATRSFDGILSASIRQIAEIFDCQAALLAPGANGKLVIRAQHSSTYIVDEKELSVALWAFDHAQAAGADTTTLPTAQAFYLPLTGAQGTLGVIGICPSASIAFGNPEQRRLLEAFVNQVALAGERAKLAEEAHLAWERVEAEFLRNTLLSSVSHDLRTPLAAIAGAASSLLEAAPALPAESQRDLTLTIYDEAQRMERLVTNLLDMTRLESGGLHLKKEWQPVQEVIGSALHHVDRRLQGRRVELTVPAELPLVPIDAVAIEQVLVNLLDNAIDFTPSDRAIEVAARASAGAVIIDVSDRGPGLPSGPDEQVFVKFFRCRPEGVEGVRGGIGLGLAISRGIVEAHGGKITAHNRAGGGAVFSFTLPIEGIPPIVDQRE